MKSTSRSTRHLIKGRGIMLYLAVAALLAVLALGGYLFFQNGSEQENSNVTDKNSLSAPSNQNPIEVKPGEKPATAQTFKIPELGVKMILPEGLEGLEYGIRNENYSDGTPYRAFVFSTSKLMEADPRCSPNSTIPLGAVTAISDNTDLSGPRRPQEKNLRHLGDKFYIFSSPQSGCSDKDRASTIQFEQTALLLEAFQSTELIETR